MVNEQFEVLSPDAAGIPWIREWGVISGNEAAPLEYHVNDGYEITYAESGCFSWEVEAGNLLEISGREVCVTGYRSRHRGVYNRMRGGGRLLYVVFNPRISYIAMETCILFSREEAKVLDKEFTLISNSTAKVPFQYAALFQLLMQELSGKHTDAKALSLLRLRMLSAAVISGLPILFRLPPGQTNTNGQSIIAQVENFIKEEEYFNVESAAKAVGLSRGRLYDIFMREKGMPPSDFFLRMRCEKAAELLLSSDVSVTSAAYSCGFSSGQHLSRMFRKIYGYSPTEFRRLFQRA